MKTYGVRADMRQSTKGVAREPVGLNTAAGETAGSAYVRAMAELANFDPLKKAPMQNFFTNSHFNVLVNCWEPGQENTKHYHHEADNVVILLEGKGSFLIGEETRQLDAVSFIHVPKGMAHHFKNTGPGRMVTVHIYGPALTQADTVRMP